MVAAQAREHRAPPEARGERLDQHLARTYPELTRSRLQGLIEAGHVLVDGRPAKVALRVLAERTKIGTRHLENVEADRYEALPTAVYLRGILMSLARELGLDPLKVSRSYLALAPGPKKK